MRDGGDAAAAAAATPLELPHGVRGSLRASSASIGTVVCVHGALDSGASFARVRRRLAGCDVVTYDRRGYRTSRDAGRGGGLDAHASDLLALSELAARRGAVEPLVVLGHSFGGLVALGAAARSGDVAAVVAYEPPFPWGDAHGVAHAPLGDDPAAAAESFFRRIVGDASWDRLSEAERRERRLDGPALLDDLAVLGAPVPFDVLGVTVPVVVGVSADAPARRAESVSSLAAALPRATRVEFARAGHGAHLSSPGELARVTLELLGAVPPGAGPARTAGG